MIYNSKMQFNPLLRFFGFFIGVDIGLWLLVEGRSPLFFDVVSGFSTGIAWIDWAAGLLIFLILGLIGLFTLLDVMLYTISPVDTAKMTLERLENIEATQKKEG